MVFQLFLTILFAGLCIYSYTNPVLFLWPKEINNQKTKDANYKKVVGKFDKLSEKLGSRVSAKTLTIYKKKLALLNHPYGLTAEKYYTLKILLVAMFFPIGIFVFIKTGVLLFLLLLFAIPVIGLDIWLNYLYKNYQSKIRRSLLDAIELLWVPCDAGMNFMRAIKHLSKETDNIVIHELEKCFLAIESGKQPFQVFKDLVERTDVKELESFIQSIMHNQELGAPISKFLFDESEKMRSLRHSKIQEIGQKVGVKVLLIVVVFMGPSFLILIFGPLLTHVDSARIIGDFIPF